MSLCHSVFCSFAYHWENISLYHLQRSIIHNDMLRKKVQERLLYLLFLYIIKENMSLKEICPYVILSSVLLPIIGKTYPYIIRNEVFQGGVVGTF